MRKLTLSLQLTQKFSKVKIFAHPTPFISLTKIHFQIHQIQNVPPGHRQRLPHPSQLPSQQDEQQHDIVPGIAGIEKHVSQATSSQASNVLEASRSAYACRQLSFSYHEPSRRRRSQRSLHVPVEIQLSLV
jgi:hypothetical protein